MSAASHPSRMAPEGLAPGWVSWPGAFLCPFEQSLTEAQGIAWRPLYVRPVASLAVVADVPSVAECIEEDTEVLPRAGGQEPVRGEGGRITGHSRNSHAGAW